LSGADDAADERKPTMKITAKSLLRSALKLVESASIREWAMSERNAPIWLQIAENAVKKGSTDPHRFAAYITATAIGL
jgi:hypothetical protein